MTDKEQKKYLLSEIKHYRKMNKELLEFYNATMEALHREKYGHLDGWSKVQKISDKLEDNYELIFTK